MSLIWCFLIFYYPLSFWRCNYFSHSMNDTHSLYPVAIFSLLLAHRPIFDFVHHQECPCTSGRAALEGNLDWYWQITGFISHDNWLVMVWLCDIILANEMLGQFWKDFPHLWKRQMRGIFPFLYLDIVIYMWFMQLRYPSENLE